MMKGHDIICLSNAPYDHPPLVMHYMMNKLAEENRILFVEPVSALTTFFFIPS